MAEPEKAASADAGYVQGTKPKRSRCSFCKRWVADLETARAQHLASEHCLAYPVQAEQKCIWAEAKKAAAVRGKLGI